MQAQTATEVSKEFVAQLSNQQLFDQYRILELRKRFWSVRVSGHLYSEVEHKLKNIELWMNKVWDEMVRRIDEYDFSVFAFLIETGNGFSILNQ